MHQKKLRAHPILSENKVPEILLPVEFQELYFRIGWCVSGTRFTPETRYSRASEPNVFNCPFESRLVQIYCTKNDSMLYFFTPYSFNKKLFEAWDDYMNLIKDPSDWVCMMDGDVLFFISDFGHQMQTYIDKYPDAGLFTCYASRTSRSQLKWKGADMTNPSLIYHRTKAEQLYAAYHGQVEELGDLNALGYLMLIRKSTWLLIREQVKEWTAEKDILGVDTRISKAIRKANFKSYLMRGMYVLHYYRMKNGEQDKSILL